MPPLARSHTVRVWCAGELDERGFVLDYAEVAEAVRPVLDVLDHHLLNEINGLQNPTTECLAAWIFCKLAAVGLRNLSAVEVKESATTGCVYEP